MQIRTAHFRRRSVAVLALILLGACTWRTEHKVETVSKIDAHIVLDIRQIKAEASQIEGYVRDDSATTPPTSAGDKPASYLQTELALRRLAAAGGRGWLSLGTLALAAEPEKLPPVSGEDERKAVAARKERVKKIEEALAKGHLGENDHGYAEVLVPKDEPNKELRQALERLAREENADRKTIYRALAERHKDGKDAAAALPAVETVFAGIIREQMKKGQMFQAPRDKDQFAEFQKSRVGKAHADAKPGAWLKKAIDPEKKD